MLEFIRCGDLLSFYIMARTLTVQDVLLARTARVQDGDVYGAKPPRPGEIYAPLGVAPQKSGIILRSLFYILNYIVTHSRDLYCFLLFSISHCGTMTTRSSAGLLSSK